MQISVAIISYDFQTVLEPILTCAARTHTTTNGITTTECQILFWNKFSWKSMVLCRSRMLSFKLMFRLVFITCHRDHRGILFLVLSPWWIFAWAVSSIQSASALYPFVKQSMGNKSNRLLQRILQSNSLSSPESRGLAHSRARLPLTRPKTS